MSEDESFRAKEAENAFVNSDLPERRIPVITLKSTTVITMPTPIAVTSEAGIRLETLGQAIRIARHATPTSRACQLEVPMF